MQLLKIETTARGYVDMAHKGLQAHGGNSFETIEKGGGTQNG